MTQPFDRDPTAPDPLHPDPLETELLRLELLLIDPAVRTDRRRVSALLTENFIEFGSSGRVFTRDSILDLLAAQTCEPPAVEAFACRQLSDNVALVTYRAVRITASGKAPQPCEVRYGQKILQAGKSASTRLRSRSNQRPQLRAATRRSDFVPSEKLILFAAGAMSALQAANQKNGYPNGDQDGQHTGIGSDQMNEIMHIPRGPEPASIPGLRIAL